jgi:hypothetical protein
MSPYTTPSAASDSPAVVDRLGWLLMGEGGTVEGGSPTNQAVNVLQHTPILTGSWGQDKLAGPAQENDVRGVVKQKELKKGQLRSIGIPPC